jgi:hypothetical protein
MEPEVDILPNTYRFPVAYDQDRPRSVKDLLISRRIPIDATKSHVKARGGWLLYSIDQTVLPLELLRKIVVDLVDVTRGPWG